MKRIVFLHTVTSLAGTFNEMAKEMLPRDWAIFHIVDEMLLKIALAEGGLSPFQYRRVVQHVAAAEEAGAALVQFTCSSISPCADAARPMVHIPIYKIDEPMVDRALALGTRIGVAATAATTLKPTQELVHTRAALLGKPVQVQARLCEGAYAALFAGDTATHDRLVRECLAGLLQNNDVVVLAQASMARVADTIPEKERRVPILASPRLAMEKLSQVLRAEG